MYPSYDTTADLDPVVGCLVASVIFPRPVCVRRSELCNRNTGSCDYECYLKETHLITPTEGTNLEDKAAAA